MIATKMTCHISKTNTITKEGYLFTFNFVLMIYLTIIKCNLCSNGHTIPCGDYHIRIIFFFRAGNKQGAHRRAY